MAMLEIKCPMCKGTLWIDQSNGKVVDHSSAEHAKADFDSFMKAQQDKSSRWDDRLHKAKDETAKRKAEIDERFRKARENPDSVQGDYESPFKWD
jgi:Zn-finger nucleic acid-binding protein